MVTPGRVDPVFIFQEYLISDMVLTVMAFSYDCLTASLATLSAPCRKSLGGHHHCSQSCWLRMGTVHMGCASSQVLTRKETPRILPPLPLSLMCTSHEKEDKGSDTETKMRNFKSGEHMCVCLSTIAEFIELSMNSQIVILSPVSFWGNS